jgi:hypothetical protein
VGKGDAFGVVCGGEERLHEAMSLGQISGAMFVVLCQLYPGLLMSTPP